MHGHGLLGDLLHLALYLVAIAAWMYFWLICVLNAERALKRFLGVHALLLCALMIPTLAIVLVGGSLLLFGFDDIVWSLLVVGVAVPMAGVKAVNRTRQVRYHFDRRR